MADEGTPFSEAVEVKPLPGTPNIFSASIPDDWKGAPLVSKADFYIIS